MCFRSWGERDGGERDGGEREGGERKRERRTEKDASHEKKYSEIVYTMCALVAVATEKVVLDTDSVSNSKPLPHLFPHLHHLHRQRDS